MACTVRFLCIGGACIIFAPPLYAQNVSPAAGNEQSSSASGGSLEEIVVTAQKRQENLQAVPISVSALTGDQLEQQQIHTAADLVGVVPSLQSTNTLGRTVPIFSLRGISAWDPSFNQDGPIAIYYDDVYKGTAPQFGVYIYDLDRVEVLEGPQGTLYGKNTTGGAIKFVSRVPDGTTDGYFSVGYGNYNHFQSDGAAQTALTDTLSARIAYVIDEQDGWVQNLAPGAPNLSSTDEQGIRLTLRYMLGSDFDFILRASYSHRDPYSDGAPAIPGPKGIGNGLYELFGLHSYFPTGNVGSETNDPNPERDPSHGYQVSGTANAKLNDGLSLTSITSWDEGNLNLGENTAGAPIKEVYTDFIGDTTQFTQDVRLTSTFDGPFGFIAGAFYNDERVFESDNDQFFADINFGNHGAGSSQDCAASIGAGLAPIACAEYNQFNQGKSSIALYGDTNYKVTDEIKLRLGLRYTRDKGELDNFLAQYRGDADSIPVLNTIPGGPDVNATTSLHFSTNKVTPKVGLDYTPTPDVLIYGSFSQGYRGSAFNAQAFTAPDQLDIAKPETVNAFEVGLKSEFLEHTLRLNGAAFWYNYRNQQVVDVSPQTLVESLIGLPKSRMIGAEFEFALRPTNNLTFTSNLSLLDSEVIEGTSSGVNIAGNQLLMAPRVGSTDAIDWSVPIRTMGIADFRLAGSYTGKQYFDLQNRPQTTQAGYWLMNGDIRLHPADDGKWISFWVKNITDTHYYTSEADFLSSLGFINTRLAAPRTYGVTVGTKF